MRASASRRGSLFAIGGREARQGDTPILEQFVKRAGGGAAARVVVLSTASSTPQELVGEYTTAFRDLGVEDLAFFHQRDRAEASDPALLEALDCADGVFLTGGNQLRLVTILSGTPADAKLRERFREDGLHLAGTSAGASALSAVMIARGKARSSARLGSVRMSPGLGILPQVIVDQHFRERDRFGRLLAAVLTNPSMLGFGLDEDTAFELDAHDRVSVLGSGTLTIIDGTALEATNLDTVPEDLPAAFAGMRMHALTEGWRYDLATRRVEPAAVEPVLQRVMA